MTHIAVDIGNSRLKLECHGTVFTLTSYLDNPTELTGVVTKYTELTGDHSFTWWVGSVHRATLTRLTDWLKVNRPKDAFRILDHTQLPISVDVESPEKVGMDRLLAAVAANTRRRPENPAIIVDFGTAITVDMLRENGGFQGGAILPGPKIAAEALHAHTDALPRVKMTDDCYITAQFSPKGKNTTQAIHAGLYWGTIGAVRELLSRLSEEGEREPDVFLTGGGAEMLLPHLEDYTNCKYISEMVLVGIREVIRAENPGVETIFPRRA